VPVSDKDKLLRDSAITLMEMRKKIGAEMEAHLKP
jgi:hypothetical protein